jgi:type II secretory pathway pseudopilin PulG
MGAAATRGAEIVGQGRKPVRGKRRERRRVGRHGGERNRGSIQKTLKIQVLKKRIWAFTLVELLVVLAILSLVMFVITPRIASVINPERSRTFMLRLRSALQYLSDKAVLEQQLYLFNFDLNERRYYFSLYAPDEEGDFSFTDDSSSMTGSQGMSSGLGIAVNDRYLKPASMPDHLRVESFRVIPGEETAAGLVTLPFTPNGMMFSFEILFIEESEKRYLMTGNGLNNRIRLFSAQAEGDWQILE